MDNDGRKEISQKPQERRIPQPGAPSESDHVDTILLATLMAKAPVGFAFLNRELRYIRLNNAFAQMNGLPAEAYLGRHVGESLPVLSPTLEPLLSRVLQTGKPTIDVEVTSQTAVVRGQPRCWLSSYYPVRHPDGDTLGVGVIISEITERRRIQAKVARLGQQMQAASARERLFVRDVLTSATDGKLRLCHSPDELPPALVPQGTAIPLTQYSLRLLRRKVTDAARLCRLSRDRSLDLVTAAGEAAMNAVVHGRGGQAHVFVDAAGTVQVRIRDRGPGIGLERLPHAALQRGYSTAGSLGQGFKLMLGTVDQVWLLTGRIGTTVVLEQSREAAPPRWLALHDHSPSPARLSAGEQAAGRRHRFF